MSDSCLGFACLPTKGRLFLKYMIFESYLTAQRCAVCDRHRVLYSLCCIFLSPVLTHRATISWKRVNHSLCLGRQQGGRFLEPPGPAALIPLSPRGHCQLHVPTQEGLPYFPMRAPPKGNLAFIKSWYLLFLILVLINTAGSSCF